MSKIHNTANPAGEAVEVNRAQIEHRAMWMGLIYDEMKKAGIDAETIIRKAVRRCGKIHGGNIRKKCAAPPDSAGSAETALSVDCEDFRNAFFGDVGIKTFGMDNISSDTHNVRVEFHYCALVSAWQKLGFDDETCGLLCDIAMEGDRGIADAMGLKLNLTDTIAKGCGTCKLHFHR